MKIAQNYYPAAGNLFIKWFITFAAILSLLGIAWYKGLIALITKSDISHLSLIIFGVFMVSSLLAGKLSYGISRSELDNLTIEKQLLILNYVVEAVFYLGLLGTIIGFCYMMHGTLNANIELSQIINQLKVGSATKLYTTGAGIASSVLLQLQLLYINHDTKKLA